MHFPPGRWHARWIWCERPRIRLAGATVEVDRAATGRTACFRRVVDLAAVPNVVPARLTADSRYVLWVNATEVSRGPVRGDPRNLHYDEIDLAPFLRPGPNVVAVLVRHYGQATPWWAPVPPTYELGFGGLLFEARVGEEWLVSDDTWRVGGTDVWLATGGVGLGAMMTEVHDAEHLSASWREPGFDDSAWKPATALAGHHVGYPGRPEPPLHPYGPMRGRPIPALGGRTFPGQVVARTWCTGGEEVLDPVLQVEGDERSAVGSGVVELLTVDFGEEVAGTMALDVDAPAGARFDVSVAESIDADGRLVRLDQHSGFRYRARGSDDQFETFDTLGLRYARIAVRSERPIEIRSASIHERLCPGSRLPPFACNDEVLERIWTVGRRTVDLCSLDSYVDCPSREQRAWTGDGVVHQLVDLTTNADWSMAARYVELGLAPRSDGMLPMAAASDFAAADQAFIPDWALHWVHGVHNLWRYRADRDEVAAALSVAERALRWFVPFQGPDGLLAEVTGWVLIDWSAVSTAGRSSALNALWARALRDFDQMATWLGDEGRAAWARHSWHQVRAGFDAFWDERRGIYVDNLPLPSAVVADRPVSQAANASAVVAGLVPEQRLARVVGVLVDRTRLVHASWLVPGVDATSGGAEDMYTGSGYLLVGPPEPWWDVAKQVVAAEPFFRYVVHDAVAAAGRADLIPDLCRDWAPLLERSATTFSETWWGGSRCHGWSATPTRDLIERTLGISPAQPGFRRASVAPQLGDLDWASGTAPTPHGPISVEVGRSSVIVDSAVPFALTTPWGTRHDLPAGRHRVPSP
jgi:hypothetical protein